MDGAVGGDVDGAEVGLDFLQHLVLGAAEGF